MAFPSQSGERALIALMRGELPPITRPASPGRRDVGAHPCVDEGVIEAAVERIADDGGTPGSLNGRIDEELADNATTNIVLGDKTEICAAFLVYHCTRSTDTEWGFAEIVILQDGSTVEALSDPRWPNTESGCGLTIAGNISGDNLRLSITTSSTGSAADFRATYQTVPA